MGFLTAFKRSTDSTQDEMLWNTMMFNSESNAGVNVNQQTALNATAVLACVTMLSEDFAKLTPRIFRTDPDTGESTDADDHPLYDLLYAPNDWQNWFEFAEMTQVSLLLRGNGYAVIVRDGRGNPIKLIPVNADWVALWEAPDGGLFYRVTANGLHMMAELRGEPFLVPIADMFHIRGFTANGLLGASRIMLAKEAVGLALGLEQQASRWMANRAHLSGILTTDAKLTKDAAERIAQDWKDLKAGLSNAGKIAVLEQGLKYLPIAMNANDLQIISQRTFQLQEVARIWRIPLHMLGDLTRSTNNNIGQQSQEYINLTLSSYTSRWRWKLHSTFALRPAKLFIDFDLSELTRADITARYNNYARAITAGFLTPEEARVDDGRDPKPTFGKLLTPANLSAAGSDATGAGADGGGRPPNGDADANPRALRPRGAFISVRRDFNADQPRDANGEFAGGAALTENQNGEVKLVGVYATAAGRDDARAAIEAAREENGEAANLQSHDLQIQGDVKPGDKVFVVHSPDPAADVPGATPDSPDTAEGATIHGAFASRDDATAAATKLSQDVWATSGPDWELGVSETDAEQSKVFAAWASEHPDDPEGDRASPAELDAFAHQALGLAPGAKEAYPGLAKANEFFAGHAENTPAAVGVFKVAGKKMS
jgi:HK97 family phage portal protein